MSLRIIQTSPYIIIHPNIIIIATTCPTITVVAMVEEPAALLEWGELELLELLELEEVVLLMRLEFWNTLMFWTSKYASLYTDGCPITQSL